MVDKIIKAIRARRCGSCWTCWNKTDVPCPIRYVDPDEINEIMIGYAALQLQLATAESRYARLRAKLAEPVFCDYGVLPNELVDEIQAILKKTDTGDLGQTNDQVKDARIKDLENTLRRLRLDGQTDLGWEGVQRQNTLIDCVLAKKS